MRLLSLILAVALLTGCADQAFQNYVRSRQAAIAAMPNGPAKYRAQQTLDLQILSEKRRQAQEAQNAATALLLGAAAGAAAGAAVNQPAPVCPTCCDDDAAAARAAAEQIDDIRQQLILNR